MGLLWSPAGLRCGKVTGAVSETPVPSHGSDQHEAPGEEYAQSGHFGKRKRKDDGFSFLRPGASGGKLDWNSQDSGGFQAPQGRTRTEVLSLRTQPTAPCSGDCPFCHSPGCRENLRIHSSTDPVTRERGPGGRGASGSRVVTVPVVTPALGEAHRRP